MRAFSSNLKSRSGVIGKIETWMSSADSASEIAFAIAAGAPIVSAARIPTEFQGGSTAFDKNVNTYLWRDSPSDSQLGVAMALDRDARYPDAMRPSQLPMTLVFGRSGALRFDSRRVKGGAEPEG